MNEDLEKKEEQSFDKTQGRPLGDAQSEKQNNEMEECKKKCEEYLNGWKRERADFMNYKKDEVERISYFIKYANEKVISNILPILDNIKLAEKQLPEKLKNAARSSPQSNGSASSPQVEWTKGFLQIQNQIKDFLNKEGIEEIETLGKNFDPETMEAIGEIPNSKIQIPNIVVEEIQKGYIMEDKVLRPAKVKVSK